MMMMVMISYIGPLVLLLTKPGLIQTMGGPNLEIFKFSLYLFVPIAALVHFGDPEWYRTTVVPVRFVPFSLALALNANETSTVPRQTLSFVRPHQPGIQLNLEYSIQIHSVYFQRIPTDQAGVREELARIKAERIARRAQREAEEQKNAGR